MEKERKKQAVNISKRALLNEQGDFLRYNPCKKVLVHVEFYSKAEKGNKIIRLTFRKRCSLFNVHKQFPDTNAHCDPLAFYLLRYICFSTGESSK